MQKLALHGVTTQQTFLVTIAIVRTSDSVQVCIYYFPHVC
jgi:hypothetical protein